MDPNQQQNIQHATEMMYAMVPLMIGFVVVAWAIILIPFWQIFKKSGLGGPLSLLMILPLVNLVMLYVLAFSRWKVVPAPEYAVGYPPQYPPAGYVPPVSTPAPYTPAPVPPTQPPA